MNSLLIEIHTQSHTWEFNLFYLLICFMRLIFYLLRNITKALNRISKLQLSWICKAAAFQMQVLPKILYAFKSLPILLPASFSKCNTLIQTFLTHGRNPRIAFATQIKHSKSGGIGFPYLLAYYRASLLDQLKFWMEPTKDKLCFLFY